MREACNYGAKIRITNNIRILRFMANEMTRQQMSKKQKKSFSTAKLSDKEETMNTITLDYSEKFILTEPIPPSKKSSLSPCPSCVLLFILSSFT